MDIASLIGLLGAIGMIVFAMVSGGGVGPFIDVPSILIVFGGTFFAVSISAPSFLASPLQGWEFPSDKDEEELQRWAAIAEQAARDV